MPNQPICSPEKKAEAIRIAVEKTPREASRVTGIGVNTIKHWVYDIRNKTEPFTSPNASLALRPAARAAAVEQVVNKVQAAVEDEVFARSVVKFEQTTDKLLDLINTAITQISSLLSKINDDDISVDWLDSMMKALSVSIEKYQIMTGGATNITVVRGRTVSDHRHIVAQYGDVLKRVGEHSTPSPDNLGIGKPVDSIESDREASGVSATTT